MNLILKRINKLQRDKDKLYKDIQRYCHDSKVPINERLKVLENCESIGITNLSDLLSDLKTEKPFCKL